MKTIAIVYFTNGQVARTTIRPKEEFGAYCDLASLPSVRRVEIKAAK